MMTVAEFHRQIRAAGFYPAQRDSSYNTLREYRDLSDDTGVVPLDTLDSVPDFIPLPLVGGNGREPMAA